MELQLLSLTRIYSARKKKPALTAAYLKVYSQARSVAGLEPCETLLKLRALLDTPVLGAVVVCRTTGQLVSMMHVRQVSAWPILSFECYQSSVSGALCEYAPAVQEGVVEMMIRSLMIQAEVEWLWSTDECGRQPFALEFVAYGRSLMKVVEHVDDCSMKDFWARAFRAR